MLPSELIKLLSPALSVDKIDKDLNEIYGVPRTSLNNYIQNKRKFPDKYESLLLKYIQCSNFKHVPSVLNLTEHHLEAIIYSS